MLTMVLVLSCMLPAAAAAASWAFTRESSGGVGARAGLVVVGSEEPNRVRIGEEADQSTGVLRYSLFDPAGISVGSGCVQSAPTSGTCEIEFGYVLIELEGGDDVVSANVPKNMTALGGLGDDTVRAGHGDDTLRGDVGGDRLSGGPGDDNLFGDADRDRLVGGAGSDKLFALDGQRDLLVDCGPGKDVAIVDRGLDRRPVRCERVRYEER